MSLLLERKKFTLKEEYFLLNGIHPLTSEVAKKILCMMKKEVVREKSSLHTWDIRGNKNIKQKKTKKQETNTRLIQQLPEYEGKPDSGPHGDTGCGSESGSFAHFPGQLLPSPPPPPLGCRGLLEPLCCHSNQSSSSQESTLCHLERTNKNVCLYLLVFSSTHIDPNSPLDKQTWICKKGKTRERKHL